MSTQPRILADDFPSLRIDGKQITYLDAAATTPTPNVVIDAVRKAMEQGMGAVDAGLYKTAEDAALAYRAARETVRAFIHAESIDDIIFTSGATAGLNLLAETYGRRHLQEGDEVVVTVLEHHANLLPWQRVCRAAGAKLAVVKTTARGDIDFATLESHLSAKTKIVAITHISNVMGTVLPIARIAAAAHAVGAFVVVDGAQAIGHYPIDVIALGADAYVASAHKAYGPAGIGFLYLKQHIANELPPYLVGGRMVETVKIGGATFQNTPHRFEAGTPNVAGAIGMAAGMQYLSTIGMPRIATEESALANLLTKQLAGLPEVTVLGSPTTHAGIVSFTAHGAHPHDMAALLAERDFYVRAGDHCAEPLHEALGLPTGSLRVSVGCYTTEADILAFVAALDESLGELKR
ncbi:MAG: cysteine desulfurase [Patescibacteria group bacterium]